MERKNPSRDHDRTKAARDGQTRGGEGNPQFPRKVPPTSHALHFPTLSEKRYSEIFVRIVGAVLLPNRFAEGAILEDAIIKYQGTVVLDELARVDEEPPAQGEQPEDVGTTPHRHYRADLAKIATKQTAVQCFLRIL